MTAAHLSIKALSDDRDVLFGVPKGRALVARMLEAVLEFRGPCVVFLDFSGIVSATASFLREGPLEFRRIVLGGAGGLYPVIANASPAILEDLELLLTARNDALLVCDFNTRRGATNVRLVGRLESKQDLTYKLVLAKGEVDAGMLASRAKSSDQVGTTAWNNRLAALSAKGLIVESLRGRSKTFKPVLR